MPARARDIIRAFASFGVVFKEPKKGSHWKARLGEVSYTIPLHNGPKSEVDDIYIRGACRAFNVDEDALRKLL